MGERKLQNNLSRNISVLETLDSEQSSPHRLAFCGLFIFAVLLRLVAFQGYAHSDPLDYSELAFDLSNGIVHIPTYSGPPVFPIRLGIYAPTAALIKFFGLSGLVLGLYPLLISAVGCLLTYLLARHLFSPLAGLIALGAVAVVPIDISMASALWPDAIAAFWANLGVALALYAFSKSTTNRAVVLGLLSGLCFGVSWLCKETVIYLVPFMALAGFVFFRHTSTSLRVACMTAIAVGSMVILSAETILFARITGDPLFHYHTTEYNYVWSKGGFFESSSPIALAARVFVTGPVDMLRIPSMSFAPIFALLGVLWSVLFRQRKFLIPAAWLGSLLFMFNFMTTSFRSYKPLLLFDRYLYPLLLPSLILFGGFLATLLLEKSERRLRLEHRFWALAVVVVFFSISAFAVRRNVVSKPQAVPRTVAAMLQPSDVIYTDFRTAADLVFFRTGRLLGSDSTTIPWEETNESGLSNGAYVLIDHVNIDFLKGVQDYKPPTFANNPPPAWTKIRSFDDADLYVVNRN